VFFADRPKTNVALGVKPRFPVLRIDLQDRLQFSIATAYAAFDDWHGKPPDAGGATRVFPPGLAGKLVAFDWTEQKPKLLWSWPL